MTLPDKGVDFILSIDPCAHGISTNHFRLVHNKESGLLTMIAHDSKRPLTFDSQKVFQNDARVVFPKQHLISVGALQYSLEWTDIDVELYNEQVQQFRRCIGLLPLATLDLVNITPQDNYTELPNFFLMGAFAHGSTCILYTALSKSNHTVVACKKMVSTGRTVAPAIQNEIKLLTVLRQTVCAASL